MESKNMFQKNTCNVQQIAVISKIHNMQWLKNNPPLPGHMKPKANKGIVKGLTEDLKASELTTESTMSVPNISDSLPLVNSTNVISTINDSKNSCDIESKINEKSVILENKESTWDVKYNMTDYNQQMLILQELEQNKMINIAIKESLLSLQRETQTKVEEESKGKEQDIAKCDLTSSKIKDCTSEKNQEDIHDDNNNDKLSTINEQQLKISDIGSDTLSSKGADKEDQSNNICLNKETDASLNLKTSNEISVTNDISAMHILSTMSKDNDKSREEIKCDVKTSLEKKEVSKVITKNTSSTGALNKKNNIIVGQSTESKMKYGIKQSLKNLSTEVSRKTPDKRNTESNESTLNTSKVLRNKSNLQPRREAITIKHSPEVAVKHTTKNLKENEQSKTALNSFNKQYKVNRMCYTPKREESGSISKVHNFSKTTQNTDHSNSPNSVQSINKPLNKAETMSTHKKILKTSDAANIYEDMKQKTTLKNHDVTETFITKACDNRSGAVNKILVDMVDKEINTASNEVKESNESSITNLTNEHFTHEYIEQKKTNTNPFLENFSNLSISNNSKTDTTDFKNIIDKDLNTKSAEPDNVPSTNIPYVFHIPQQSAQQEQIPSQQSFIRYIPDQFIMDCSVNTALPKFHSNTPYTNTNTVQLSQYGNIQTMSNIPSGAQVQNCSNPNILPPSTGNVNTLLYQMPNVIPCNSQNVIRPPPNFCIHPISQEEQYNLSTYGLNPTYFMNPMCVCRNDCFPPHPQNWNLLRNYPVPLQQSPYHANYSTFCDQRMQLNNMFHKNTAAARPLKNPTRALIPQEQNVQKNYGKPMTNTAYNIRNSQNNKIHDTQLQVQRSLVNTQESIDLKKEKLGSELLSDKESNNLPMISPKACMIYGSGLSKDFNTVKPQMKYNGTTNKVSNCHFQYQKNNEYRYISKEQIPHVAMDRGKPRFTQPNQSSYKAQY